MISTNNYRASMRDFVVRLHSSGSSSSSSNVPSEATEDSLMTMVGVPQLETLQKLLSYCGAPGSTGCTLGEGDMIRTTPAFREELHPYLRPISQSQSTGNYICAYKRVGSSEDDICPIVESGLNLPGMKLLALNRFVVRLIVRSTLLLCHYFVLVFYSTRFLSSWSLFPMNNTPPSTITYSYCVMHPV